jgi:ABC-2 type transport system permease protein
MAEIWRGTWVVAYREILRFVSERSRILSSFAMPLLFLVIFGAGFTNVIGTLAPGVNFIQFMYPGIIAMTVLTSSLFAGISVVWDREFGFLKEILVAPIGRTGIVVG